MTIPEPTDFGEIHVTALDGGRALRVDQADPQVRVTGHLVRQALGKGYEPVAELAGDRLVIHGINKKVIYQIGAYHPDGDWYEARWPD